MGVCWEGGRAVFHQGVERGEVVDVGGCGVVAWMVVVVVGADGDWEGGDVRV